VFCPQCEAEYREGISQCRECGVALVPALPPGEAPEWVDFVTVLVRCSRRWHAKSGARAMRVGRSTGRGEGRRRRSSRRRRRSTRRERTLTIERIRCLGPGGARSEAKNDQADASEQRAATVNLCHVYLPGLRQSALCDVENSPKEVHHKLKRHARRPWATRRTGGLFREKKTPTPPSPCATVAALPRVGGLHHRYEWREAA